MSDLGHRIGSAFVAQGATALAGKIATALFTIALARILVPEDFGLFTLALVVTGLANMLSNFGFQSYIIQAKDLSQNDLDVCFTLNVALSAFLGLAVAALGWFWVDPPPLLPEMLQMYGLHVFVSGLSYIPLARMKRELDFTRSSRAELANTVVAMGGRVAFALGGFGALCFPLGDVLGVLACWWLAARSSSGPLRLVLPRWKTASGAIVFGAHSTSIGLASFFANQSDKMLLGYAFPVPAVGLYGFASNTAAMFYKSFIVPQSAVFLASFSRLRTDPVDIRNFLQKSTRLIFSLSLPVCMLLILDAERIVATVFGEQWRASSVLVRIFATAYLLRSMISGITGLQLSFGLAAAAARTKWINAFVFVLFFSAAVLAKVGLIGYALAYLAADVVTMSHNVAVNGRLVELKVSALLRNLLAPIAIAAVASAAWFGVWYAGRDWPEFPGLLAAAATWVATYVLLSLRFNRMVVEAILERLRSRRRRRSKE